MSSQRILRRIRKEFDYEDYLLGHYSIKYTAGKDELRICCPSCGDSKYKCYVNNDKKRFNCFKCDFDSGNYDVFDLVAMTEGISRGQAVKKLLAEFAPTTPLSMKEVVSRLENQWLDVEEDEPGPTSEIKIIEGLPEGSFLLDNPEDLIEKPFWDYLQDVRGLTEKEIRAAGVHFVPQKSLPIMNSSNKYVGDIGRKFIFPVYAHGGLVSWIARGIGEDSVGPKYVNCPESEINRTVWPFVNPSFNNVVCLTEGILDCLAVRKVLLPAYATFGKKISYDQIEHLKRWNVQEITIMWDPDARKDTARAVEELKMHGFDVFVPDFSLWPNNADLGDLISPKSLETFGMSKGHGLHAIKDAISSAIYMDSVEFAVWQIQG